MPNILSYLSSKKPYAGIPYAYCIWYNEKYKFGGANIILQALYFRMLVLSEGVV